MKYFRLITFIMAYWGLFSTLPGYSRDLCNRKALIDYYHASFEREQDSTVVRLMIRIEMPALRKGEQIHATFRLHGTNGELYDMGSLDYASGKGAIRKQDREYERRHRERTSLTGKYSRRKGIDFTYSYKIPWQDWYPTAEILIEEQVEKGNYNCVLPLRTKSLD